MEKSKILGIGNPLLDLTVVGDAELLKKYELEPNNAILATDVQKPMYEDLLKNHEVQFSAGGSVLNALRVCQWIIGEPKICVFMGAVGNDQYSGILESVAKNDGVDVIFQFHEGIPTGTCASIITNHLGKYRSLCANLAAAEKFTIDHILKPENFKYIENAEIFYISGFFLTVSLETVCNIGEIAVKQNKVFALNLSAPFICDAYKLSVVQVLYYCDIIFGNETEALTLGSLLFNVDTVPQTIYELMDFPKHNKSRSRLVVITQGCKPILYAKDNRIKGVRVPPFPLEDIVDTNGAGDAFVGGFLSQFLQEKPVEECIKCGIWASHEIMNNFGCNFDKMIKYNPLFIQKSSFANPCL